VSVPEGLEAHDMLEPFHQSFVPDAKLMKAVGCWDVGNDHRETLVLLNLQELTLKPFELVTRVLSVVEHPPVEIVASLHVDSNHFSFLVEGHHFGIVSVLRKHISFFLREPVVGGPRIFEMINGPVRVRLRKVLNINWPSIMIPLNGKDRYLGVSSQSILEGLSDVQSVLSDLLLGVVPNVMS